MEYISKGIRASKALLCALGALLLPGVASPALTVPAGVDVTNPVLARTGDSMTAAMDLSFGDLKLRSTEALTLSPMIVNGADTLRLPSVGIYGKTRWYQSERKAAFPLGGEREYLSLRYDRDLTPLAYSQKVPYAEWMNGSELILQLDAYGCAGCQEGPLSEELALYKRVDFVPAFIYETAVAEASKTRELSGKAYIDFPVNQTVIYPDYRRNSVELAKITGTIDSVRNDRDVSVTSLSIKGFASPEGSYENNIRLAKGRTEALKNYVQTLYHFPEGFIRTSYEPEDWEGLREYVAGSHIENRDAILAIIDSDLAPDPKNTKIQRDYPVQYKFLLANVYPGLRHSDYKIEYEIRQFSDVAEIAEIIRKEPGKLSLNEMFLLGSTLEPGTEFYNDVFETAVRMYPDEPVASLNAANAAMQRGDLQTAARYLDRSGQEAEAVYARGMLAALQGDYGQALELVNRAASMGLAGAAEMAEHLKEVIGE